MRGLVLSLLAGRDCIICWLVSNSYNAGDHDPLGGIKGGTVMNIEVLRTTIMEIGQWVDGS